MENCCNCQCPNKTVVAAPPKPKYEHYYTWVLRNTNTRPLFAPIYTLTNLKYTRKQADVLFPNRVVAPVLESMELVAS